MVNESEEVCVLINREIHVTLKKLAIDQGRTLKSLMDSILKQWLKQRNNEGGNSCETAIKKV